MTYLSGASSGMEELRGGNKRLYDADLIRQEERRRDAGKRRRGKANIGYRAVPAESPALITHDAKCARPIIKMVKSNSAARPSLALLAGKPPSMDLCLQSKRVPQNQSG